ncbi:hypothetical protein HY478_02345 [Candidatus Uhrbacteria bacterium]|nr:hypothetical protein [Candidatus Uhrbacteria bacterium]
MSIFAVAVWLVSVLAGAASCFAAGANFALSGVLENEGERGKALQRLHNRSVAIWGTFGLVILILTPILILPTLLRSW